MQNGLLQNFILFTQELIKLHEWSAEMIGRDEFLCELIIAMLILASCHMQISELCFYGSLDTSALLRWWK